MTVHRTPGNLTARLLRTAGDCVARRNRRNPRLCIVNYHRILATPDPLLPSEPDVATFRWQMELLAECFNVMPLHEALHGLKAGALPPRAVCITFDDGYRSVHDLALPILQELRLHATVFVTSGYLGKGNMWNDRIIEAVQALPVGMLDLRRFGMGVHPLISLADRRRAVDTLTANSKYLSPDMRKAFTQELENMHGRRSTAEDLMLTKELVGALAQRGIDIGGHTVSHPILATLDDAAARDEIETGKRQLEAITGRPVRLFAYPNGKVGIDFNERHIQMAREAGFTAAFTTAAGAATGGHDVFQLPRSRPWDNTAPLFGLRLLRWLAGEGR